MKLNLFKPVERVLPDEWAEQNIVLDRVGKYSYENRPFMKEPTRAMGMLNNHCRVVLECSAQLSKSTALMNLLGWIATYNPVNTLFVMDSMSSCQKIVRNRIRPFLRDQVGVSSLQKGVQVKDKSASSVNISLGTGANLMIGSARSPSDLCSFPAQFVLADETSRFPEDLGDEGDPITLLQVRMLTFPRSMFAMASTPTTETCSIHQNYLVGTQERWCVKCDCGCYMKCEYSKIDFSGSEPTYACEDCGTVYTEKEIRDLPHLFAPPANETPYTDKYGRVCRSFHIGATCTPECYTWSSLRAQELEARAKGLSTYKSFVNVVLGDVYVPGYDEALNVDTLLRMKTFYDRNKLPNWISLLTVGIDTQDNRFEYVVMGFSKRGKYSALLERGQIQGDLKETEVWDNLKKFLVGLEYVRRDGLKLHPAIICPDSGGHFTQDIYALSLWNRRIKPVKGYASTNIHLENSIIKNTSIVNVKTLGNGRAQAQLTLVNTVYAKDLIRSRLLQLQTNKSDSLITINADPSAGFDIDFFNQMDSEIREENTRGIARWVKKGNQRNEMLDCCVYAMTAHEIFRLATMTVAGNGAKDDDFEPNSIEDKQRVEELKAAVSEESKKEKYDESLVTSCKPKRRL